MNDMWLDQWESMQEQEAAWQMSQFEDEQLRLQQAVEAAKRLCTHAPIADVRIVTDLAGISEYVFPNG